MVNTKGTYRNNQRFYIQHRQTDLSQNLEQKFYADITVTKQEMRYLQQNYMTVTVHLAN